MYKISRLSNLAKNLNFSFELKEGVLEVTSSEPLWEFDDDGAAYFTYWGNRIQDAVIALFGCERADIWPPGKIARCESLYFYIYE
jgi:hypothetical protein